MISQFFSNKSEPLRDESDECGSYEPTYTLEPLPSDMILGKDVFNDLEVFIPYDNVSSDATLISKFNNTQTHGGQRFVKDVLQNPIYAQDVLSKRVDILRNVATEQSYAIDSRLEKDFLWMFSNREEAIDSLLNSVFFMQYFTKSLNHSEAVMTGYNMYNVMISPMVGILSPLVYFILPFIILKIKFRNQIKLSFTTYIKMIYQSVLSSNSIFSMLGSTGNTLQRIQSITYVLSLVFYFQGILNSAQLSHTTHKIIKYLAEKVNNAMLFLQKSLAAVEQHVEVVEACNNVFVYPIDRIDESLANWIRAYVPFDKFSIMSNFGKQLKIFKTLDWKTILPVVNKAYILDGLQTIKKTQVNLGLTHPIFIPPGDVVPRYVSEQCWNIHLSKDHTIKNDLCIGNTIITGPNAGGKSTLIKMICTNVLLSQTFGLSASAKTEYTPYYFINTQINIPDCKGQESLFEAEMNRCLYNLQTLKKHPHKPALVVMDEIFNSTNVVEAIAGAYSILSKMSTYPMATTLITTHLSYLTKLKKTTSFECRCMSVDVATDGTIAYPYIFKGGVSKQYIALELLRERGFEKDIIDTAIEIKKHFC